MPHDENPELIDWDNTSAPEGSRFFGFVPALALGMLAGTTFSGGWGGYHYGHNFCYPRGYHGYRDFYTCSPRFICRPVPY